jgi:hypothetical protein
MKIARTSTVMAATCLLAAGLSGQTFADESMTPLAMSGNWVAFAHHVSMLTPPDTCAAAAAAGQTHIILRVDNDNNEFRVANEDWSLPVGITGTIKLMAGT